MGLQSGDMIVPMYNWSRYFEDVTSKQALKGITQMHHFWFTSRHPGKVFVINSIDDNERCITLLRDPSWRPSELPELIIPQGLSLERQHYLYDKIREFCPEEYRDLVCPKLQHPLS